MSKETEEQYVIQKQNLTQALTDFQAACEDDGRNTAEELCDSIYNALDIQLEEL